MDSERIRRSDLIGHGVEVGPVLHGDEEEEDEHLKALHHVGAKYLQRERQEVTLQMMSRCSPHMHTCICNTRMLTCDRSGSQWRSIRVCRKREPIEEERQAEAAGSGRKEGCSMECEGLQALGKRGQRDGEGEGEGKRNEGGE